MPIGALCIGIWVLVIFSIFIDDNDTVVIDQHDPDFVDRQLDEISDSEPEQKKSSEPEVEIDDRELTYDNSYEKVISNANEYEYTSIDYSVRGILPGDFSDIAPDNIISIDQLLEFVVYKK